MLGVETTPPPWWVTAPSPATQQQQLLHYTSDTAGKVRSKEAEETTSQKLHTRIMLNIDAVCGLVVRDAMTWFLLWMWSLSNYTGDCDLEAPF